jgi:hypothetical protein
VAVERARPRWHLGSSAAGTATTGVVGRVTIAIRESWLGTPRAADPAGPSPIREITAMVLRPVEQPPEHAANAHRKPRPTHARTHSPRTRTGRRRASAISSPSGM